MNKLLVSYLCISIHHFIYTGATALCRAARAGHEDVVKCLLGAGANPNICNEKLQYPLHFAAFKKKENTVDVLLNFNANALVLDRKGRTPAEV